jgi:hypothetical protein
MGRRIAGILNKAKGRSLSNESGLDVSRRKWVAFICL